MIVSYFFATNFTHVFLTFFFSLLHAQLFALNERFIVFNLIIAVICDAVAIIESAKHEDDERSGVGQTDGAQIDESTQMKIQDLNKQLSCLVYIQRQMQQQIDHLTKEYFALQGIPVPDDET